MDHPNQQIASKHPPGRVRRFFAELGPGLITGAADDDPSGISTYSVAGAAFGYSQLWLALFSFPLMAAVQLMCARLGLVTGLGLAGVIRRRYPRWVLWGACALLVVANVVNIAADLGGMAAAMEMLTGWRAYVWLPFFAAAIILLLIFSSYRHIARVFKWLTLVLFAYVIAAFLAKPQWGAVLRATFVPHLEWNAEYVATFIAILGTTISPYLFFWQAAQEVEEERALGRKTLAMRRGATDLELKAARDDVFSGMFFAGVVMYFIILTTGATLHQTGQHHIETARQAAEALRPLAGNAAYLLFTIGLIGTGMLGVPVLAGSAAYAIAEALHWRGSLNDRPRASAKFYAVVAAAVLLGLALDYMRFNAVRMLFIAAIVNGVLAPPLLILIVLLTSDPRVMGKRVNPGWLRWLGWLTTALMAFASIGLLLI
ncbi:MAG: Nramp family divalent metal transporter [Acidobacteria bacterium]|nr:Nramp family divalent metal transporter [Acidobacteriota bacterium]MBI3425619.1 Nramp family divalent metal transporter [Acidobacteriota bacterium]